MRVQSTIRLTGLLCVLSLAACDNATEPTMSEVSGSYSATAFTTTTAGVPTNQLAAGALITIALDAQGSTTGQLFVPDGDENGGDLIASLVGTWDLTGSTVTFEQGADTFIRDMQFTVAGSTLVGDQTFSGTRVQLTLTRQ